MKQSVEIQTRLLLKISAELKHRMAEIHKLREMIRSAEAEKNSQEAIHPAVPQRIGNELRF